MDNKSLKNIDNLGLMNVAFMLQFVE